jgi:hypothetical protein
MNALILGILVILEQFRHFLSMFFLDLRYKIWSMKMLYIQDVGYLSRQPIPRCCLPDSRMCNSPGGAVRTHLE